MWKEKQMKAENEREKVKIAQSIKTREYTGGKSGN